MPDESVVESIGIGVGEKGGCTLVRLENGDTVPCRGGKNLHRTYGWYVPHIGMKVRVRLAPIGGRNKKPLLIDIVRDE